MVDWVFGNDFDNELSTSQDEEFSESEDDDDFTV